ncbi:MAG: acyl-CoA/acyl-ACP dehydrogenase [Desulfobacteraceae bacterium]|nr:acyl-CoA/acyl-ACP dehydrogenase [Desulfobacteraceae bacterium]MBC2755396.1 acyl-CoA/acyl-ACP dehydrogenase [Desulfobacteraceae bacterium]
MLRKWGEERYAPIRRQVDDDWKEHKLIKPLFKEVLVDLGVAGAMFPLEVGGLNVTRTGTFSAVLCEELGRIDLGFAAACFCSVWPMMPIMMEPHRNMELCEEFGERYCGDELCMGCNAMTEPPSGSDVENLGLLHGKTIQTTARLDGDNWIINGHKIWPTNSGDTADLFGVLCTTSKGSTDENDIAYIYVPADTPGVSTGGPYRKAGCSADMNTDIWFEDVKVPKRYRAHGPGEDVKYLREMLTYTNIMVPAACVGMMKATYEIIKKWSSERVVAGKILKEHSINAAVLAEIAINIESTSAWVYMMARELDYPEEYGMRPWEDRMYYRTCGLNLFGTDAVVHATGRAMELMGSYGYCCEFDLEKIWRDAKMTNLWEGGRHLDLIECARYWYDLETI